MGKLLILHGMQRITQPGVELGRHVALAVNQVRSPVEMNPVDQVENDLGQHVGALVVTHLGSSPFLATSTASHSEIYLDTLMLPSGLRARSAARICSRMRADDLTGLSPASEICSILSVSHATRNLR